MSVKTGIFAECGRLLYMLRKNTAPIRHHVWDFQNAVWYVRSKVYSK